jgi:hypothetical protein
LFHFQHNYAFCILLILCRSSLYAKWIWWLSRYINRSSGGWLLLNTHDHDHDHDIMNNGVIHFQQKRQQEQKIKTLEYTLVSWKSYFISFPFRSPCLFNLAYLALLPWPCLAFAPVPCLVKPWTVTYISLILRFFSSCEPCWTTRF